MPQRKLRAEGAPIQGNQASGEGGVPGPAANDPSVVLSLLRFDPMYLYIAFGLAAVIGVGRLLLFWAD
jgi:hypothetical protein